MDFRLRLGVGDQAGHAVEIALRTGHFGAREPGAGIGRDARAIERRALAGDRQKHFLGDRRIERGQPRAAAVDQRHRNGPVRKAGDIGAGAVDRIDDPGGRLGAQVRLVLGLFRQPAGVGSKGGKPRAQEIIDRDVAFADRRIDRRPWSSV